MTSTGADIRSVSASSGLPAAGEVECPGPRHSSSHSPEQVLGPEMSYSVSIRCTGHDPSSRAHGWRTPRPRGGTEKAAG